LKPKIIYIAGDGRSGSTLLDSILSNIEGSVSVGECHRFWVRFYEKETLCGCGEKIERCTLWSKIDEKLHQKFPDYDSEFIREKVKEIQYFKNFKKIPKLLQTKEWQDFAEIVIYFYNQIAETSQRNIIIDSSKSIGWCYFLQNIGVFDLRIIHLERNLASVANSWKKKMILPEYYDKDVFMPQKTNKVILKSWIKIKVLALALKKNNYFMFLKYESFCQKPEFWLTKIKEFVGEPFDITEFIMIPTHSIGGNPMRSGSNKKIVISNKKVDLHHLNFFEKVFFKSSSIIAKTFIR